MKFAAFDLEIAKLLPENASDIKRYAPLGISCAALAFNDKQDVLFWQGVPRLPRERCADVVADLHRVVDEGYTLLTWNGCSFDFFVLAQESGLLEECSHLALNHVDLMLIVTFTKGYYLGLDKALAGGGLGGKVKTLTLSNGSTVTDMSGAKVPALWASGEHQAVLDYLRGDVVQLIDLARVLERSKAIRWRSQSGAPQSVPIPRWLLVKDCFDIPEPDTSWMRSPPSRRDFVAWMPSAKQPGTTRQR